MTFKKEILDQLIKDYKNPGARQFSSGRSVSEIVESGVENRREKVNNANTEQGFSGESICRYD